MPAFERHPLNPPGDFYVKYARCIACTAPEHEAPDLMTHIENGPDEYCYHCYFHRQPETPDEVEQAIRAVWVSCCRSVRYGGRDPEILARLARYDSSDGCDFPLDAADAPPVE